MKSLIYLLLTILFVRCTEVVKPAKTHYLHIAATSVTKADREIVRKFSRQTGIKIDLFKIGGDTLLEHIGKNRYNPGFDVLITEDQRFVYALSRRRLLATIDAGKLFARQIRQFNNGGHKWLAIAHDPLVISSQKDSIGNCRYAERNTDVRYAEVVDIPEELYPEFAYNQSGTSDEKANFLVTRLSKLLIDKQLQKRSCWSYLQLNKKYESSFLSVSEYQYARNHESAQRFMRYYFSCRKYVANSRNYQSTEKNGWANARIEKLKIRRNHRFDR